MGLCGSKSKETFFSFPSSVRIVPTNNTSPFGGTRLYSFSLCCVLVIAASTDSLFTRDLMFDAVPYSCVSIADARATQLEVERRLLEAAPGSGSASDLEAWVPLEAWRRALDLVHEASMLLHDEARPAGSPDTVHVSATWNAFTMTGGLTGEAAGWRP